MSENLNLKTITTIDPSPFKHLCVTIGELPSTFLESMSYYELLAWFVNYLENTVIPAVNANGEATAELQELFIELKTYVDTYFDNLDVQEEINHKVDELVESGELQRILNSPATKEALGGVIVGDGLDVTEEGKISVKPNNFVVSKINGDMNNSMFPDIIKFGNKYYMVFRSGSLHSSFDGKISFCHSEDGVNWSTPETVLINSNVDYRDPFLSVIGDKLYLSCFTRIDNGDTTVTLTGYIYEFNPTTLEKTLVRTLTDVALFGKIIKVEDQYVFGSYNNDGAYLYKGASLNDASITHSFASGYELVIRYFGNKYYLITRTDSGLTLKESSNLTSWTDITTIPQMSAGDSFTKIGDYYVIGYRDSIIDKHEYGNFALAVLDDDFNTVTTYKVFASQTQDCGYSGIYYDEDEDKVIIATYVQDGSSKTSVYCINCNSSNLTNFSIFQNKFDLDNCLKPATLSNDVDYANVIELINKTAHGKFINMLDADGSIRCQIYKDPNSAIAMIENPNGGVRIKGSANVIMGVGTYSNLELQGTGNVLMRQGLEVRGTTNTQVLKVRALNASTSPYVDVVKMNSGAYSSLPANADVPTGFMYWDTTNARLLVNAGGTWKQVTLASL